MTLVDPSFMPFPPSWPDDFTLLTDVFQSKSRFWDSVEIFMTSDDGEDDDREDGQGGGSSASKR
jgi:hypothetical protein